MEDRADEDVCKRGGGGMKRQQSQKQTDKNKTVGRHHGWGIIQRQGMGSEEEGKGRGG